MRQAIIANDDDDIVFTGIVHRCKTQQRRRNRQEQQTDKQANELNLEAGITSIVISKSGHHVQETFEGLKNKAQNRQTKTRNSIKLNH